MRALKFFGSAFSSSYQILCGPGNDLLVFFKISLNSSTFKKVISAVISFGSVSDRCFVFCSVSRKRFCISSFSYTCSIIVSPRRLLKISHFSWSVMAILSLNVICKCHPLDCCLSLVMVLIAFQNPLFPACFAVSINFLFCLSVEHLNALLIFLCKKLISFLNR